MPSRPMRTYAEFLVEACALWLFLSEGRTAMSRAELIAEVAAEIQEEGEELAGAAVEALFRDGLLEMNGPYVRCRFVLADLTEAEE